MPTPKLVQIEAWSFSRWQDYEKCPAFAKFKHVQRLKEPGNSAMDRGTAIHTMAEQYANGALTKLPEDLQRFKVEFNALRKVGPQTEQEWAFTKDWVRTGWFDRNVFLRIKVDVNYFLKKENLLVIIDHKSGKEKPEEHKMQLELYALGGMLLYPDAARVSCRLWYLDAGTESKLELDNTPKELERLKKLWLTRTRAMLNDTRFAPRAGRHCNWCFYRKSNGGPCQF